LPWNLCPYCGTPAPGMRRENLTLNEALRPIVVDSDEEREETPAPEIVETTEEKVEE
jgi:hypothetical protein